MTEPAVPSAPPDPSGRRTARKGPSLGAVAISALTAILSLLTILWWLGPVGNSAARPRVSDAAMPVFILGEPAQYDAIRERPLFIATRTPPAEAELAPAAPAQRAAANPSRDYRLQGTLVAGEGSLAVLMDNRTQKITRLRQGKDLMGWTLSEVSARRVVFERDGRRHVMVLTRR